MKTDQKHSYLISISSATIIKVILVALASVLLFGFIKSVSHYLELIAIAAFLALALNPFVDWMHKMFGGKRILAVGLSYLALLVVLGGLLVAITSPLARQTVNFINQVPQTLQSLKTDDSSVAHFARWAKITDGINNFTQDFSTHTQDIAKFALNVAGRIANAMASIIAVLVLTFMMLSEGPELSSKFWRRQAPKHQKRYRPLAEQMYAVVTGYINGQLMISLIGAVVSLMVLVAVGVPNAIVLAVIIFLTGLIPLVGHPIGAAFVTLITLFSSPDKAIVIGIFYLVYLQIQAASIQPYVQSKSNDMTPLTVFMAAIVGIAAGGFLGAFIAIPLAGCMRLLFLDYVKNGKLG